MHLESLRLIGLQVNYQKNTRRNSTFRKRWPFVWKWPHSKVKTSKPKGLNRSKRRSSPCIFQVVVSLYQSQAFYIIGTIPTHSKKSFSYFKKKKKLILRKFSSNKKIFSWANNKKIFLIIK